LVDGPLFIGSNTTIDGRGADITLEGLNDVDEIYINNKKNVIVHNITFYRVGHIWDRGGALSLVNGTDLVWVDHVTFRKNSDESLSMGRFRGGEGTAGKITVSYCLFDSTPKAILAGWGPDQGEDIRLTVHHSAFINGVSRIPLLRMGWLHFYNNYVLNPGWSANEIHEGGQALIENNYYIALDTVMNCGTDVWDPEPGWICERGNILVNGAKKVGEGYNCDSVFKASDYYDYTLTTVDKEMYAIISLYAGWSESPLWYKH
jgi:pectate lyase